MKIDRGNPGLESAPVGPHGAARRAQRAIWWGMLLALAAGCSQPFTVTTTIDEAPVGPATVAVQPIIDALPADAPAEARPRPEDLEGFESYLIQELQYRPWLELSSAAGETPDYDIRGSVVQYETGSGFLRFLGIGGATKVTTHLELVQHASGRVVFAGDFQGSVAGWPHLGDHLFSEVAAVFAEQLDRRVAKLRGTEPERRRERMRLEP